MCVLFPPHLSCGFSEFCVSLHHNSFNFIVLTLEGVENMYQSLTTSGASIPKTKDHAPADITVVDDFGFVAVPKQITVAQSCFMSQRLNRADWDQYTSEADISARVQNLITDIFAFLGSDLRLVAEASVNYIRPDYWVVKTQNRPVGVVEVKKPQVGVLDNPNVLGELFDNMNGLRCYFGVDHPFGIVTTLKQWRICWFENSASIAKEHNFVINRAKTSSPQTPQQQAQQSVRPMLTPSKMQPQNPKRIYVSTCDGADSDNVVSEPRFFCGTPVLESTNPNTLRMVVSCSYKMSQASPITFSTLNNPQYRTVLCMTRTMSVWCPFQSQIQWDAYPLPSHRNLYLLEDLGAGSHGRAWLACASNGSVCVAKFGLHITTELENWHKFYPELRSMVRIMKLTQDALVMPFFVAVSKHDRSSKLQLVRTALKNRFHMAGSKHDDVRWANIGLYVNSNNEEEAIVFDLARVGSAEGDAGWIDQAISRLDVSN
eukprot:c12478_g1_i1.p1 GENE.c12478_g1_i1~~c12478_g1_i1.p1  ORF type:complete len:487 (+),score=66.84 c12478_g1_i1:302-1762(+)